MIINTKKQNRYFIFAAILLITISGCSTTHQAVSDPDYAPIRPISARPLPISDGAIYKAGFGLTLFEDTKAHRVGDIITVVLKEKTNASKKASTTTAKNSAVSIAAPTIFGRGVGYKGDPAILSATIDADREFEGEGDSTQSNSLTGEIAVTIAEVYANGNMLIRGEKLLTLNQGSEHVRISGIIRPTDISPANTILSTQVANAKIIYGGQGVLADANSKGWLARMFDSNWWPF